MADYKSMYYNMASQVANAIDLLIKAQQDGEEGAMQDDRIIKIDETLQPQ